MTALRNIFLALLLGLCGGGSPATAEPLVADLSRHLVAITTGFAGTDVLMFGAVDGPGDVVVVVRGPTRAEVVRRKDRLAGIWVNAASAVVEGAPSFYHVAATRPLAALAEEPVLDRHQIGAQRLEMTVQGADRAEAAEYREALLRLKRAQGLYGVEVAPVTFLGERLFRTEIHFPSNVPVGTYGVEIYLFRDGEVAGAQTTPLVIGKVGIGAELYDFAHRHAEMYGIVAVILAASAGWVAAVAFKKG